MLSEGDSAGSGSRISAAINKHCPNVKSTCIVNRSRRKIGHFNPDFVLSNPETDSEEIQQIIDQADIIHFKDDEPISRNWNGLEIPIDAKIVHTAGGSSFRGVDFGIESSEKIKDIEVNFNQKWKNQKRTFGRLIHADGEKLQVDGSDYTSHSHNNVWSGSINLPKDANVLVFSGHQLLIEEGSGKNYDIRSIIVRYFDSGGSVIETRKKNTGSVLGKESDFEITFPINPAAKSVKFSFFSHKIYKTNYRIKNLNITFAKIKEWKYYNLISQFNVANSTWPLEAYDIADVGTVLTPDLLHREHSRIVTPHVKPSIKTRKKKKKGQKIVIAHAPSNTGKKGTREFVIPAIEKLKREFDIEFNLIQNVSHKECIDLISRSDIFIDQMVAGYYGNAGLEAMTMGIPVLAYISDETIKLAGPEWSKIPIIRASNLSVESVVVSLEKILRKPESLILIGKECRDWVNRIHSEKRVAKMWEKLYLSNLKSQNGKGKKISGAMEKEAAPIQNEEYLLKGGGTWKISEESVDPSISIRIESDFQTNESSKAHISGFGNDLNQASLEIYRLGWYSGKGARLVHRRIIRPQDISLTSSEEAEYRFLTKDWHPGCYRAIIRRKDGGVAVTHFLVHEISINSRNLIIFPKISCSIWSEINDGIRDNLYNGRNFQKTRKMNSINVPRDLGDLSQAKIFEWLIPTINWMEMRGVDYSIVADVDIEDIEFTGGGCIIFVGENRFWTPEIHSFVKDNVIERGRDILILGSGIGENITYFHKGVSEAIFPYQKDEVVTRSSTNLPISLGGFVDTNRPFSEYSDGKTQDYVIKSVVDNYQKGMNFSRPILSIDGEEFGEISSRHFILKNGTNYFHGGVMDFPRIFLQTYPDGGEPNKPDDIIMRLVNPMAPLRNEGSALKRRFVQKWSEFQMLKRDFGKIPRVCLVSAFWKRPTLTNRIFAYYDRLKDTISDDLELVNIAVGSEGKKSRKIAESNGFKYLEHETLPLSKKWDSAVAFTKQFEPDAIVIVGSDDIIDANLLISLIKKIDEGRLVVGIKDLYIYDKKGKVVNYWPGYGEESDRYGETIGLSRVISRNLLEMANFSLWPDLEIDRSLDLSMTNRFIGFGLQPLDNSKEEFVYVNGIKISTAHSSFKMRELGGVAIDVKTGTNITPLDSYELEKPEKNEKIESIINSVFGWQNEN